MVTDFSHHPFDMFISIDFRYEKILVKSKYAFEFVETIKFFAVGCACNITRNIHIPPRVVIINPIPCVEIGSISLFCLFRSDTICFTYWHIYISIYLRISVSGCKYMTSIQERHVPQTRASISSDTMPPTFPWTNRSLIWLLILTFIL